MIYLDENELTRIVREAVRKELEPVRILLENRKLSVSEVKKMLGIRSHNTIASLIRRGELISRPDKPGGRPKFTYSEVMTLKEYQKK